MADDAFYEDLEDAMIMSDVGVTTTLKVIDAVKTEAARQGVNTTREIKKILRDYLYELMRVDDSYYDFEKQKSIISVYCCTKNRLQVSMVVVSTTTGL